MVVQGKLMFSVLKVVGCFVIYLLMMVFFYCYLQVDVCLWLEDCFFDFIDDGIDLVLCIIDIFFFGLYGKLLMLIRYVICVIEVYLQQYGMLYMLQDLCVYSCISFGEMFVDVCWKFCWEGKIEMV